MRILLVSLAAIVLLGSSSFGQVPPHQRPDFSGKWVLVSPQSGPPDLLLGSTGAIVQDESTITFMSSARSSTFRMDDVESQERTNSAAGGIWTLTSRAR
jgi:hypothetical protein